MVSDIDSAEPLLGGTSRRKPASSTLAREESEHESSENAISDMSDLQYLRYCIGQILFDSRLNILLVCVPLAALFDLMRISESATFTFALIALCPLAERLGFVTEQLAMSTNETVGGLLNASFGNATELIVSVFALRHGLTRVIQLSLLGSVISNLLMVLGTAFLLGGARFVKQSYDAELAVNNQYLLTLGGLAVVLATCLANGAHESDTKKPVLEYSRFISIGLLFTYLAYLAFQLSTHQHEYDAASERKLPADLWPWALKRRKRELRKLRNRMRREAAAAAAAAAGVSDTEGLTTDDEETGHGRPRGYMAARAQGMSPPPGSSPIRGASPTLTAARPESVLTDDVDLDEDEAPFLTLTAGVVWMGVITLLLAYCSEVVVDNIEDAAEGLHLPLPFISAILLPIAGNAAEHASALIFSWRNRMELALGVAVGSATQISVLVLPVCVVLGWIFHRPLSLNFEAFEAMSLLGTIILVSVVLRDGRAHWLKGVALVVAYFTLACGFWFRKDIEV